ncbi:protein PRRC2A [Anopheles gambiae]|uniref:protein PRRC2A n=1 Tax=Anopheles gambiae TaxID=7165 RepID=UPI002AC91DA8|nr:protein PRRC2A [Anopheles gambiae]
MGLPAPGNALILVKYSTTRFLTNQNRTMVIRIMDGAWPLWCLVGCLLLVGSSLPLVGADETVPVVGELLEPNEYGSISPEDLCQSLCGECQCRGRLVSENQCQCSCDFAVDSVGGQQCTLKVQQLCSKMDVQCVFNGTEEAYVREPRGCHTMSCYEKEMHHDEGGYDGYEHGGEGYGYDEGYGHGVKQLVCCKDKHKHKEKKHKHKKHKKHEKHMKFHVVIKGKIPEHSCHGGHEGGEHYEGYEDHGGYRAATPDRPQMNPAHMPMDVAVWTNRQKQAKKHPFQRPVHHHQQPSHHRPASHYGRPPSYGPPPPPYPVDPRAKSADPPSPEPRPEPMHHPQDTQPPSPQQGPPPPPPPPPPQPTPPAEPESPPVTPFPQHQLTPPPNLYDGAPVGPKPAPQHSNQEPPKHHSFTPPSPPSPPSPPVRPPMITVDPPPRRIDSSRSFDEPSHSSCQFDSYDFNYYHAPPPPPPPPPSSYRSFSSSYVPSYPTSHYHPHDQYDTPEYYPEKPVEYSKYDDNSKEHRAYQSSHGVHPLSDNEVEDWPEYPPRYPSDMHTYNQIISRQIIEVDTALGYTDKPFQPTTRPLRDEFEPPTAEVGPILFESAGPADKNYEMYPVPTPPPEAFIPAVPAPLTVPFEFADPESGPILFPPNSEEALYPQPTPPPHYLLAKEAGSMSSFGFEHQQQQQQFQQHPWGPTFDGGSSWGYSRSAAGPSQFRSGSSRSSAPCSRRYQ